ncbi:uncharacterized protein LOC117317556 [Pecten maximus]|uniref:uncharacterized protein LOC117317556 n=1 Tax=Pecten maximus TaxID=6579 RepID=UPI00145900FA|nr:uncharacterized protein LOC117317556 [Pecten maximus]
MEEDKENLYLTDDELHSLKVPALKGYLRKHGQYVTGNKPALVDRAKGVRKVGLTDVNYTKHDDATKHDVRHREKLTTPLGEIIPEPSSLKNWTSDVSEIPDFTDSATYDYLVLTMKATRQFRSRVYFEDRHLHSVHYQPVSEECSHGIVRCKVIPSIPTVNKKENPDHEVWICLSKVSGKIHSANCNCTAGTGEACNHISALLYALEDITKKKKDGTLSSTSQKCKWNNPRKRKLSPKKVQDMKFHRHVKTQGDISPSPISNARETSFKPTLNVERVKKRLMGSPVSANAGWLTFFGEGSDEPTEEIPKLHDVPYLYHDRMDLKSEECKKDFEDRFTGLKLTVENADRIEKFTNGQSQNDMWHEARRERITSSNFGTVCKCKADTKPESTLRNILGYRDFQSKYCDWGIKHEPVARRMYANAVKGDGLCIKTCGLIVNPKYPHLGASPDGLVNSTKCDCDDYGVLEIKCPASEKWKFKHPSQCALDPDFFCYFDHSCDTLKLKQSHRYYYQVQGQMLITNRKWCDFLVWTLKGWTVERIQYDEQFCLNMVSKLAKFYLQNVIPEIFSQRVKRDLALYP